MSIVRRSLWAAWICITLVLCAERWNAFTGAWSTNPIDILASDVQPGNGFAYETKLNRPVVVERMCLNRICLSEDREVMTRFSPRRINVDKVGRGIFTIQKDSTLVFSASDNSDPRTNGRKYFLRYPMVFARPIGRALEILWVFLGIFNLIMIRGLVGTPALIRSVAVYFVNLVGRHPAIFLALPSLYFCLNFTPLWKGVDAIAQLILPAGVSNILHFPPLYCFAGRIPFWLGNCLDAILARKSLPPFDIWSAQWPSLTGVWLLIFLQHIALIGSLCALVKSLTQRMLGRGLATLFLATCSGLYAEAHSAGTDALSQVTILLLCSFGLRILRTGGLTAWIGYSVALLLAFLTRSVNIVFSEWLVLSLFAITAFELFQGRGRSIPALTQCVLACVIPFLVVGATTAVQDILIRLVDEEYRSTLGRTLSDRVGTFLEKLPTNERERLEIQLQKREEDRWAKRAIELQNRVGPYYLGMGGALAGEMRSSGIPAAKVGPAEDKAVLRSGLAYLSTLHPILLRVIWRDFSRGFIQAGNFIISRAAFSSIRAGGVDRDARPQVWKPLQNIPNLDMPTATALQDRSEQNSYFRLQRRLANIWVYCCATVFSIVAWCRGQRRTPIASLCLLLTGASVFLVTCCLVYYTDRYTIPVFICGVIALLIPLGEERIRETAI